MNVAKRMISISILYVCIVYLYLFAEYLFTWPRERTMIAKCWFMFGWPLKFLLYVTVPDVRIERLKRWYPLTFIMCVIWIGISSYLVSWMTTVVGDTIDIPDSIMGLTFLAAGGNMPELASIVILARQGKLNFFFYFFCIKISCLCCCCICYILMNQITDWRYEILNVSYTSRGRKYGDEQYVGGKYSRHFTLLGLTVDNKLSNERKRRGDRIRSYILQCTYNSYLHSSSLYSYSMF